MNAIIDTSVLAAADGSDMAALPDASGISVITLAELHLGVLLAAEATLRHARTRTLGLVESAFEAVPVDEEVARAYANLVAEARRRGRRPGRFDALIAATAVARGVPVYTRDEGFRGFAGVDVVVLGSGRS